jgi:hypothetical protein
MRSAGGCPARATDTRVESRPGSIVARQTVHSSVRAGSRRRALLSVASISTGGCSNMAAAASVWRARAVTPAARGPLPQTSPMISSQRCSS